MLMVEGCPSVREQLFIKYIFIFLYISLGFIALTRRPTVTFLDVTAQNHVFAYIHVQQ